MSVLKTARNMETQSLIPSGEIKQEPGYETTKLPVRNFPFLREYIKQELDSQTVKKEANAEEESDMPPVITRAATCSTSLSFTDENSFLYCGKGQLKYEGGCTEHGAITGIDNHEEGQGKGCCHDSSPQVQIVDKCRQVLGREKVELSKVCEDHSDNVGTLPNKGCNTEFDQMFYVCEMNAELCVAGTSCGFYSNVAIKASKTIHNSEKPYKCDVCGAGFAYCSLLKKHKITHTGEKLYKCDGCGLGFTRQGDLKRHKRTHTGYKPYKCDVCGEGFGESGNLIRHKRKHTGEKPYKCDVCGVGFAHSGSLISHKRTHTGEKPYKCDVCGEVFAYSGSLISHKRTRTGERPYKCDVCGDGFAYRGSLKKHRTIHNSHQIA